MNSKKSNGSVKYSGKQFLRSFFHRGDMIIDDNKILKIINANLNLKKDDVVLDLGCNNGEYVKFFLNKCNVSGIDINEAAIKSSKLKNLFVMDATNTLFKDNSFDKIYSSHVIEHIQSPKKLFREVCRILKPRGLFVAVYPFELFRGMAALRIAYKIYGSVLYASKLHLHKYTPNKIKSVIKHTDFELMSTKLFFGNTPQYVTVLRKRDKQGAISHSTLPESLRKDNLSSLKIRLVVPYFKDTHYFVPPIGLGYLATSLRKNGFYDVKIIDGVKDSLTEEKFVEFVQKEKPDVIGFQVFSQDVSMVSKYISSLKKANPNALAVIGGAHPSGVLSEVFRDFPDINFAFRGEAEKGFPMLLKLVQDGKKNISEVPGLIWKDGQLVTVNQLYFEEDLDSIGFPAWDLMNVKDYPKAPQGAIFKNWPIAPILTSRGCPYKCTYCANKLGFGQRVRTRSIKDVINEIKLLYNTYGVKEIHLIDDTFTSRRERVVDFCNQIIKNKIKISIALPNGVRLNTLDAQLIKLMKRAGVYSFAIGIESGSDRILRDMKKGLTLDIIQKKVKLISKVGGIFTTGFFIVGYPTDTKETILQTIKFAKSLPLNRAHFSSFLPLPGTEATESLRMQGMLKNIDWNKLFYADVPFTPEGITRKELKHLQRKAFFEFYFRFKTIWGMILTIRSLEQFALLMKRAFDYAFKKD